MGASPSFPLDNFPGDAGPWGLFDESTNEAPKGYGPVLYHKDCKNLTPSKAGRKSSIAAKDGAKDASKKSVTEAADSSGSGGAADDAEPTQLTATSSGAPEFAVRATLPTGESNVVDIFLNATKDPTEEAKPMAGYRRLIKTHYELEDPSKGPEGRKFEKLEFENKYTWVSRKSYRERVFWFARGMEDVTGGIGERNLKVNDPLKKDKVIIYAETQIDWLACALGTLSRGLPIVTIYATLGEEGALHAMSQTEAPVVVVDGKLLKVLVGIADKLPHLKYVFTMGDESFLKENKGAVDKLRAMKDEESGESRITVMSVESIISKGQQLAPIEPEKHRITPKKDDIAVLMYTSGTTGAPKGVLMSHGNFVACLVSSKRTLKIIDIVSQKAAGGSSSRGMSCSSSSSSSSNEDDLPENVYMACLPMAHIMELAVEIVCVRNNVALAYGNPHTLSQKGVKLKVPESKGDAELAKPTLMVLPPAILEKVFAAFDSGATEKGGVVRWLFDAGLQSGTKNVATGDGLGANWMLNKIIFKKFQAVLGGRLKMVASGSAPLSPELHRSMQTILNCPIRIGYGLTETMAIASVGECDDFQFGVCGPPTESSMIRLADWEEGNYRNSDVFDPKIGMPRGEVLIGGPLVTMGYYQNPNLKEEEMDPELEKKNQEEYITFTKWGVSSGKLSEGKKFKATDLLDNPAFTSTMTVVDDDSGAVKTIQTPVRWFRTGDIGQINKNGVLQIIDRKKDLWKGPQGEYVSFSKVENVLKLLPEVDNAMVYGKTGGAFCVVFVVPNLKAFSQLGEQVDPTNLGKDADQMKAAKPEEKLKILCTHKDLHKKMCGKMVAACKEGKLAAFEIPQKLHLCWEAWTPENDLLTAQLKLKRPGIAKRYEAEIGKMYG